MQTIIDMHTHIWLDFAEQDRLALRQAVDEVPLRRIHVSGLKGQNPDEDTVRDINDSVRVFLAECPVARGFVYLNPHHGAAALRELQRGLDNGFTGIKLWVASLANDPLNFPIYEAAIENNLPVLLHAFDKAVGQCEYESRPFHVVEAARRYPECTFIMAHVAGKFISGVDVARPYPNLHVDVSGSYGERGMVEYAVKMLGAERILFGSDMPDSDIYHNMGKIFAANLSSHVQELVLWKNAERILR